MAQEGVVTRAWWTLSVIWLFLIVCSVARPIPRSASHQPCLYTADCPAANHACVYREGRALGFCHLQPLNGQPRPDHNQDHTYLVRHPRDFDPVRVTKPEVGESSVIWEDSGHSYTDPTGMRRQMYKRSGRYDPSFIQEQHDTEEADGQENDLDDPLDLPVDDNFMYEETYDENFPVMTEEPPWAALIPKEQTVTPETASSTAEEPPASLSPSPSPSVVWTHGEVQDTFSITQPPVPDIAVPGDEHPVIAIEQASGFTFWSAWGPCSATCGLGQSQRFRNCVRAHRSCSGNEDVQTEPCEVTLCEGT